MHELVAELGVEHRVQFVAPRPHDQLADYYRAADVVVVPSHTESFGLVALEAAACGTPVVAANVGGLRLLVDDGVTGYLVEERDPHAYATHDRPRVARRQRRDARPRGRPFDALPLEHRCGASPPSLRRPRGAHAGQVQLDPHELVATHLEGPVAAEPYIQVVEYDPELRRWYVRFTCDGRDATTIYFDLHQRTLRYEVYFLPLPPEHHLELYEFLLRRNHTMYGARFSLGPDGDVYLVGRLALEHLVGRGARPDHRRALRADRAVVPTRREAGVRPRTRPRAPQLREMPSSVKLCQPIPTGTGWCGPEVQEARPVRGSTGRSRAFLGLTRARPDGRLVPCARSCPRIPCPDAPGTPRRWSHGRGPRRRPARGRLGAGVAGDRRGRRRAPPRARGTASPASGWPPARRGSPPTPRCSSSR